MSKLLSLVMVAAVLSLVIWLLPPDGLSFAKAGEKAKQELQGAASKAKNAMDDVDLQAIENELRETGRVVRRRSSQTVRAVGDATEDVRTTVAIKTQLALDPGLSALDIDVDTTDGLVTLSGRVDSATDLARAIDIAMSHRNVRQVVSTLQISRGAATATPVERKNPRS